VSERETQTKHTIVFNDDRNQQELTLISVGAQVSYKIIISDKKDKTKKS
jgi:hypothetical protein